MPDFSEKIHITQGIQIPSDELRFSFSRSGGPGGQNVNKVNTKVEVRLNIMASPRFTVAQKRRIKERLGNRMTEQGVLRLTSQRFRTQTANRRAVLERLAEMIREALKPVRKRRKTKPSRSSVESRLRRKEQQSRLKKARGWKYDGER